MAKPRKNPLAQVPTLQSQYDEKKPLCSGAQTGFQCVHYWTQVTASHTSVMQGNIPVDYKRNGHYKKDRYCKLPSSTLNNIHLGAEPGIDMLLHCSEYRADKRRRFDALFEDGHNQSGVVNSKGGPSTAEDLVGAIMARVTSEEKIAVATGVPMMAEAGGPPHATRFHGPPADSTVRVGGKDYAAQAWHHESRGWMIVLPLLNGFGTGATREEAELNAAQSVKLPDVPVVTE